MELYYKVLILFFSSSSLHASRWPLTVIPAQQKTIFTPAKKNRAVRSRVRIKKAIVSERANLLFADCVTLPINFQHDTLSDIFLDARKQRSTKVRVLLAKAHHHEEAEWKFASAQGFVTHIHDNNGKIKKTITMPALIIQIKRGFLLCNGKRVKGALHIRSVNGCGECNGIIYDGDFIITSDQDTFLCINQVKLEDYVAAVLRTESWPGWPLEVNKVFAIACRSYVMFKIAEAKRSGRSYHVKNTNAHQTYGGKHNMSVLKTAVEQTRGIVLGFKGAPILAMFDCCCGGIIPAHIEDFDFNKAPYLARSYACNFCKQSSLYSWQVSYEHAFFESLVQRYAPEIARLCDVRIIKKDKAGLVREVTVKSSKHSKIIPGKKFYSLLKEVKSFHFDVQKKSGKIIFTGRGFGHHIGLCQWGARHMVADGWDYKSILRFYYPGAYFMHLI